MSILLSGIDFVFTITAGSLFACPRCRKALPKGPRKLPHPGFVKKEENQNNSLDSIVDNVYATSGMKETLNEQKQ